MGRERCEVCGVWADEWAEAVAPFIDPSVGTYRTCGPCWATDRVPWTLVLLAMVGAAAEYHWGLMAQGLPAEVKRYGHEQAEAWGVSYEVLRAACYLTSDRGAD